MSLLSYESLKALAKQVGRPVRELLALTPGNDPYYSALPSRREAAEWFAGEVWERYGDAGKVHVRRLHYRIVSDIRFMLPNGRGAFENTEGHWNFLCAASLTARYLGLIPFDGLVDHRNAEPLFFAPEAAGPASEIKPSAFVHGYEPHVGELAIPGMPSLPWLGLTVEAPKQKFICEIWIEKSTQNDWLIPLCQRRGVNLVVGIGESSEIRCRELAQRAAEEDVPVRVFYLSDFDPGGRSMPKAMSRKVQFTIDKLGLAADVQVIPLALTPEQVIKYELPPVPMKDTEARRGKFETIFNLGGAVELDALQALHPNVLPKLVNAELDNWLDRGLRDRFRRVESDLWLRLRTTTESVRERHRKKIEDLEARFQGIVTDLEDVAARFDDWAEDAAPLWDRVASDLQEARPDLSDVEIPQSKVAGATDAFVLFDSERSYLEQMDAFNIWREGDES